MNIPHDPPPICEECQCQISVKHILIDCPKNRQERRIFRNHNLNAVLTENKDFCIYKILEFLRLTKLINKI